jgi:hypothetical protein
MNIKTDKAILKEAINNGCKTASDLAHYIKVRTLAAQSFRRI